MEERQEGKERGEERGRKHKMFPLVSAPAADLLLVSQKKIIQVGRRSRQPDQSQISTNEGARMHSRKGMG